MGKGTGYTEDVDLPKGNSFYSERDFEVSGGHWDGQANLNE